jgi:hypothetical protein
MYTALCAECLAGALEAICIQDKRSERTIEKLRNEEHHELYCSTLLYRTIRFGTRSTY